MVGCVSCRNLRPNLPVLAQQDRDTTTTSSSDDGDGSLELELLRSLARRALGVAAVADRLAQVEATQVGSRLAVAHLAHLVCKAKPLF